MSVIADGGADDSGTDRRGLRAVHRLPELGRLDAGDSFGRCAGPSRPLVQGDRLLMRVKGLPTTLTVDRLEASREVCWSAGLPGFLHARHTFTFEAVDAGSTLIRSVEPWTGLLTHVVASSLQRAAEDGGRRQLQGFDRWFREQFPGRAS